MINEHDVVIAERDLSKAVSKGCRGAVVMIYQTPSLAYEVEFIDEKGDALDVITVLPRDIKVISP
ncbi:DUF4926 domain-containing protein [Enterobacteriaceae bacterium RIT691]|nr:DUF4926 domain-containing protein [Enterobacteriaceae bacterium RIT691]